MSTGALLFMLASWAFVLGLAGWAFGRLLRLDRGTGGGGPGHGPADQGGR